VRLSKITGDALDTILNRLGRIMAEQAWIRAGAPLESVILPLISCRRFTPDQRQEAFAWVAGPERR